MLSIILASGSTYRQNLLSRLCIPFTSHNPSIDESARPGEPPKNLAQRLSREKAEATAQHYPNHLIIGSDQIAVLENGDTLGKPGDFLTAKTQLTAVSGKSVIFLTGLSVLNSRTGCIQTDCIPFTVHFRTLSEESICRYLEKEKPFDCAGSFKSEGLGISLFCGMEGNDNTSLIGLPLIRLTDMLLQEGLLIP